jgi:hypothetical protein
VDTFRGVRQEEKSRGRSEATGLNLEPVLQKGELLWPGPFCEGAHSAGNSDSIYFRSESHFNFRSLEAKVTTLWKELTTLWKNDQSTIGGNRPVASRLNGRQGEVGPMRVTT